MKKTLRLFLLASLLFSLECTAQTARSPNIIVFHINGVNTTTDEAINNMKQP